MLSKIFFSWFLTWIPLVISGAIVLIVAINNLLPERKFLGFFKKAKTNKLIYILLGATIFYNILLSVLQYFVWYNSPFSRFFLPPYQPINYFFGYIFLHFWLAALLTLIFSLTFYLFFKLVKKYRQDVISHEELGALLLASLLVGWPNFVILVPLFFLLAVVFGVANLIIFKGKKNSLTWPITLSLIIVFLLGAYLVNLLSLSVLII
jgi:hypothetical protein